MRFAFVDAEKARWSVHALCDALAVSRSGYYAWKVRPASTHARDDARLAVEIAATHTRSRGTYGSPRVFHDLRARGVHVGRKRVERLMREQQLAAKRKRRFRRTTDSKHAHPIAANVLQRGFDVAQPNQAWVTDVTCVWTLEGWLFVAVILDLCSRRAVGWSTSANNDTHLALEALRRACASRQVERGLLHHSDRGSPYASADYRAALERNGLVASMSRKGDCWDNAVAESFFATLKGELTDHETYATRDHAARAISDYIHDFYNSERRHSTLGYVCPIEYELKLQKRSRAA